MKIFVYFKSEFKRLIRNPLVLISTIICLVSPALGYYFPLFTLTNDSDTSRYIGNPILSTGTVTTCIFFVLVVVSVSKERRNGVERTIQSIVLTTQFQCAKLLAFLTLGIVISLCIIASQSIIWLIFLKKYASFVLLISFYSIVVPIATWLGVLLGCAFDQLFRNTIVSLLLYTALVIFGFSSLARQNPFLSWINPLVPAVSDNYSNSFMMRTVLFTRVMYLFIAIGLWFLSLVCLRKYQKNIIQSFIINSQKIFPLFVGVSFFSLAGYALYNQPFFDHSNISGSNQGIIYSTPLTSKVPKKVTIQSMKAEVNPNLKSGILTGNAIYEIKNTSLKKSDMTFVINTGYKINKLSINGHPIQYKNLHDDTEGDNSILFKLPKTQNVKLKIEYEGFPKMNKIKYTSLGDSEIGSKFVHLSGGALSPVIVSDAYPTKMKITLPKGYTVVDGGESSTRKKENKNNTTSWEFTSNENKFDIFAGKFKKRAIAIENKTIDFYFQATNNVEAEKITNTVKRSMDYNTKHYGQLDSNKDLVNKPLKLLETTIFQFGGYATPNFSTMDERIFSMNNLEDPLKGADPEETLMHELTHQWWGTTKNMEPSKEAEGWTDEGLTVYTTYRMVKEAKGVDYATKHYINVWKKEVNQLHRSFYYKHPSYLENIPYFLSLDLKLEKKRTQEYCEMPLKILKAEKLVGGEEAMDRILATFMNDENIQTITFEDFLAACNLQKEDLSID